ncbi:MAG TPA: hypothetical protein VGJ62_11640 [Gemmatimonadaceae bacterium]
MKPLMGKAWLFIVMCIVGGLGAAVGSILGHFLGSQGLFIGAIVGGLLAVAIGARFAAWRGWVALSQWPLTAVGASFGFIVAALIATRTLSSPVGPILSALLIGAGALLGAHVAARRRPDSLP